MTEPIMLVLLVPASIAASVAWQLMWSYKPWKTRTVTHTWRTRDECTGVYTEHTKEVPIPPRPRVHGPF